MSKYEMINKVGKGAYGVVWKAVDRKNREIVAVKKVFDAFSNPTDAQRTFREIYFLSKMGMHDNISYLKNMFKAKNERDVYLVFDLMETDVHTVIRANICEDIHRRFITY